MVDMVHNDDHCGGQWKERFFNPPFAGKGMI
jgi:hypothetical protein